MLSFKPSFSLSSFTFIKRLFNSSSLSAIRMVSFAYLRLLIFLLAILIPACASGSCKLKTRYYYTLIRTPKSKTLTPPRDGEDVEKQKFSFTAGGDAKG